MKKCIYLKVLPYKHFPYVKFLNGFKYIILHVQTIKVFFHVSFHYVCSQ